MDKQRAEITYEYIRGLIEGRGCFTFCPIGFSKIKKKNIPTFALVMSSNEKELFNLVKEKLHLKNKIYEYGPREGKDGYKRKTGTVVLMVRDVGQLKNIIVPLFYKRLVGAKKEQLLDWLNQIGKDPDVPEQYKFINKIYKSGFYDKNPKF